MNRKQLEYFMAVYRSRNIQAAADSLYISHQGLSRVIRSLEKELGQSLFIRSNRGLEPTDFAAALVPHVRTLLDTYERISGVRTLAGQKKAVVTVYAMDHVLGALGADFVLAFHEKYPDITLSVTDTTDSAAAEALAAGRADFAITAGPVDNTRFHAQELFYSHYCCRIRKDHPLAKKEKLLPKDFEGQKLIGKGREYACFRKNIDHLLLGQNIRVDIPLETSDEELTEELVERGLAIAVTYGFSARNHCGENTVLRTLRDPGFGQSIVLAERLDSLPTKAGRQFKSFLLQWVEAHRLMETE